MGRTVNPLLRLRRFESFSPHFKLAVLSSESTVFNWKLITHNCKLLCGSSSVGRAIAFQAIGREFEPRLPLIANVGFRIFDFGLRKRIEEWMCGWQDLKTRNRKSEIRNQKISRRSSGVEHFLGKEEVMGSNPIVGSTLKT